jgi:nicotinamide-nucleotide amidase
MVLGGALKRGASHCLSVTGVAGPDGGTVEKPVGMVCFGWALGQGDDGPRVYTDTRYFDGDRQSIRLATIHYALSGMIRLID